MPVLPFVLYPGAPDGRTAPQRAAAVEMLLSMALGFGSIGSMLGALPQRPPQLSGTLTVVGSRALTYPVARWVRAFRYEHPKVRVIVRLYGSGTAADAMAQGSADVAPLSRGLRPGEWALFGPAANRPSAARIRIGAAASGPRAMISGGADGWLYIARHQGLPPNRIAVEFARIARACESDGPLAWM